VELTSLLVLNLAVVGALMLTVWVGSLATRNAGIVDAFWGLGFVLIAAVDYVAVEGWQPRAVLVTFAVTTWGLRLAVHLARRNFFAEEDYRYQAMRRRWGSGFPWVSLFVVFGLQGLLMWFIALPVVLAVTATAPDRLVATDILGLAVSATGFLFEATADRQLSAFKADPANAGRVMDRGLWAWTRHPNYFGDALLWWGLWIVAAGTPGGVLAVGSPLLMTWLLVRVSGVPLLEKRLAKTRPDYAAYVARTSSFRPRPPR
jgi:steroid 5-alpha reductase family enzyme